MVLSKKQVKHMAQEMFELYVEVDVGPTESKIFNGAELLSTDTQRLWDNCTGIFWDVVDDSIKWALEDAINDLVDAEKKLGFIDGFILASELFSGENSGGGVENNE